MLRLGAPRLEEDGNILLKCQQMCKGKESKVKGCHISNHASAVFSPGPISSVAPNYARVPLELVFDDHYRSIEGIVTILYRLHVTMTTSLLFQLKLTPEYLEMLRFQALSANAKLYFGPNIPSLFLREGEGLSHDQVVAATKNTDSGTSPDSKSSKN